MIVKTKCDIQKDLHYQVFSYLNELRSWGILPGDLKILSELYNYLFVLSNNNHIKDFKDKMNLLFSSEYKKEIMEKLGMSYNTFNNGLSRLRKKGFIGKNNILNEKLLLNLNKQEFSFTIQYLSEEEYQRLTNQTKKE